MKILYLSTTGALGGAEMCLLDVMASLRRSRPDWRLAMIVGEIGFYWGHRWSHELPLLWRFHAVHHSAEHLHFLVNTRAHPLDVVFTRLCGLPLLYATGLASTVGPHPALVPALVLFIGSLWSFFIHTNVRWRFGPLEEVLASPVSVQAGIVTANINIATATRSVISLYDDVVYSYFPNSVIPIQA